VDCFSKTPQKLLNFLGKFNYQFNGTAGDDEPQVLGDGSFGKNAMQNSANQ